MTKFSNKLKKPCFWPIMGPYSQQNKKNKKTKKKKTRKIQLCPRTTSHWILAPCQNLENINDTIPRTDGRTERPDRRKDGQTLFYRTLPATAGGPIKSMDAVLMSLLLPVIRYLPIMLSTLKM